MPVQNIECQLAQGQINRYLAGDTLSEAALQQLEAHVGECADCKTFLYEKRSSLFSILGHAAPEQSTDPAPVDDPSPKAKSLISAIRSKKPAPQSEPEPLSIPTHAVIEVDSDVVPQTPKLFAKPLLYSAGLALVLIFMSTIMRDPTRFLGGTLNETLPAGTTASKSADTPQAPIKEATPSSTNQAVNPSSLTSTSAMMAPAAAEATTTATQSAQPDAAKPTTPAAATDAAKPASSAQKPEPKPTSTPVTRPTTTSATPTRTPVREQARTNPPRTTRRVNRTRSNPRSAASRPTQPPRPSGIRLYDANGNPINP